MAKYYGKSYSLAYLREQTYITREGVSLLGISEAAEKLSFRCLLVKIPFEQLTEDVAFSCIVH